MIIKSTPQPAPEQVEMAWMRMQSLLDKHLPVHHHRKNIIAFITRIAAVFILLLQIPVAFRMGNVLMESNHGTASIIMENEQVINIPGLKALPNKSKSWNADPNHSIPIESTKQTVINTGMIPLPSLDKLNEQSSRTTLYASFQMEEDQKKIELDLSPVNSNIRPVDFKLAMKPNAPLLVQDLVVSNSSQLRTRSAQYLDIPLQVTVPISDKVELLAGVQVSYLQSVQTKELSAVGLPVDMPSVSTLTSPIARTIPLPSLNENITVRNVNQGIKAGINYKTSIGEVGVKYQYGVGQIYGIQNDDQQRHMISVSFKCPIK